MNEDLEDELYEEPIPCEKCGHAIRLKWSGWVCDNCGNWDCA